ncbi:DHA2 family efflux MFS transporter permease subunit [Parafrankia colletiae]|nr:DHA2 family efflux MFS transporter permease subunit [Parafrankia colletiae]
MADGAGRSQPPAGPSTEIDPALRRLALTVTLGAIMAILDTTIVAVAIDTLGRDFDASLSTVSWITTGYLLALAIVIPLTGWAIERFGATRMWNISLVLFLAGSALCGAAWSAESLVAFRVVQGLGGGMILPICMTLLARAAGPTRMNRIMNVVGIPTLIAPILGPVIGGLIVDNLDWRWIFFVNLPLGAVALVAAWRVLPRDDHGQAHHRLDVPGLLLISPGLAALVYGLSQAGSDGGFGSVEVQVSVAVGVVALVGFVVHALRRADALLDLRLFRDRTFSFAGVATFMVGATLFGAMFLLPLYFQIARGQSALAAGLSLVPQGLGAMVAMPLAGRLADRRGAGYVVPIGMAVSLLGTLALTQIDAHTNEMALAAFLFVRGLGFGASMMPAMSAAYQTLSPAAVPRATTTLNILQRVGGSLATALVAVELQHAISTRVPGAGGGGLEAARQTELPPAVADEIGSAFGATFWWVVGLTAAGLLAGLFLPRRPAAAAGGAAVVPAQNPPPAQVPPAVQDPLLVKEPVPVEEPDAEPLPEADADAEPQADATEEPDADAEPKPEPEPEPDAEPHADATEEPDADAEPKPEPEAQPHADATEEPDADAEPKPEPEAQPHADATEEPDADAEPKPEPEPEPDAEPHADATEEPDADAEPKPEPEAQPHADATEEPIEDDQTSPSAGAEKAVTTAAAT